MDENRAVAPVEDVPEETTLAFTIRDADSGEEREAILVRAGEGIAAWLNHCQHFTHVKLDKGSGAELRGDEIVCTNHGAMFEADTGLCTFGPCEGAYLDPVAIAIEDAVVYLADPGYEFVALGSMETDDLDLSSRSNFEF